MSGDGFYGLFQPPTPEQRAEMEEQRAQYEMQMAEAQHQQAALFTELSKEHLLAFRYFLNALSRMTPKQAQQLAAFYEGQASSALRFRFDVCPGCGKNHEEEFLNDLNKASQPDPTQDKTGNAVEESIEDSRRAIQEEIDLLDHVRMAEYNLDDLRDEETGELLGFICKNCGQRYVSVEDRALREPGKAGCDGCIQKEKWG